MRFIAEDTVALIIDIQDKLLPVMYEKEELLHNTEILIKGLKTLNVPTIVTQQYTKGIGMTVENLRVLYENEWDYFDKISFSCFDDDSISDKLKQFNKKNIIICGIEAHICVLQTVIDAIDKGYHVIVVEDCISSRKLKNKSTAIHRMEKEGAYITSYESILFELLRKAGNDTFKQISKLIK